MTKLINKKRWLIITIEIISRELAGKLIIANEAKNRGWGIIFGGRTELLKYMKYLPKGIFMIKSASKIDYPYVRAAKHYGQKVVCLDAEGLVQYNYNYFAETRVDKDVLSMINLYFTWGKKQEDVLINKYPSMNKKIKTTGNPVIEIWNGRYLSTNKNALNKLKDRFGKYIAVPTSFGEYNHKLGSGKGLRIEIDSYELSGKYLKKKVEYYNYIKKIYKSYLELLPVLANELPDTNILIKIHPSEDKRSWQNIADQHSNIFIYEGNVSEYLKAAYIVLQTESTTAIESYIYGKIIFSYCPVSDEEKKLHSLDLPMKCSLERKNIESLIKDIKKLNNSLYDKSEYYNIRETNDYLNQRIINLFDINSAKNIIEYIETLDIKEDDKTTLLQHMNVISLDWIFSCLSIFRNKKYIWNCFPDYLKWRIKCNIIIYGGFKFQVYNFGYQIKKNRLIKFIIPKNIREKINYHNKRLKYGKSKREGFNKNNFIRNYKKLFPREDLNNFEFEQYSNEIIVLNSTPSI
jgi:surface carbohydrate biosynthesis protein